MISLTGLITNVYPEKQTNKETGEVKHFCCIEIVSQEGGKGALRKLKANPANISAWEKFTFKQVTVADLRIWFGDRRDGGLFMADPNQLPVLVS